MWATPMVAEWADSTVDSWVALWAAESVDCSDKKRAAHLVAERVGHLGGNSAV